ncbi:MAG: DsbA family protein [Candidatus Kerfeldbacteria bacterium]|nr:DsbA family protein [Candidatus Kerfeldbacteria bacterium]
MNQARGSATVWIVIVATVAVVITGLVLLANSGSTPSGTSSLPLDKVADSDWVVGNRQANVVLIEYSDFQCPACGAYQPIMLQLEKDYADKVAFVFRHFPLRSIHINAEMGSRAAQSAGLQSKFFEMRDKLFVNQSSWSNSTDPSKIFEGYAQEIGLDVERFKSDLNSQAVRDAINVDVDSGKAAGVSGTPTFYLNGTKLKNPASVEAFKVLIDAAIKAAPANANTNTSGANANVAG